MKIATLSCLGVAIGTTIACNSCYDTASEVVHERHVRRMQPGANGAIVGPRGPLHWGQLNFLHTTDTHGWLESHIKEQNYGADWGDLVSFQKHMKQKAGNLGVDLLLVDTGDLHDGTGFSDDTSPNGVLSNPIFDEIDYDVLTIGNHELYVSEIAYEHFYNFSRVWGEKYITSNVQIKNPATGQFDYIGSKYRYFTTAHGIRIMAFGVIFDFTGNSNATIVTKAADMIKQQWFIDAVNTDQPIDLFLLVGHNPISTTDPISTLTIVRNAISASRPSVPIQVFGGHTHIRAFQAYDDKSTGLESGRYCETIGWLSMSGINSSTYTGVKEPRGVPNPTRKATNDSTSGLVYSRRYLDFNRRTFEYHAVNSQVSKFDYHSGVRVTGEITDIRKQLNITYLYGCAPDTYCITCQPIDSPRSIYSLLSTAASTIVINPARATTPRIIIFNSGGVRFDLVKGTFTSDDATIVAPFPNVLQYIPDVPYAVAKTVLNSLNNVPGPAKRDSFGSMPIVKDSCVDPTIGPISGFNGEFKTQRITRRQTIVTPGYTTVDDFGTDGDDTPHSTIPQFPVPNYIQANGSFPTDGSIPDVVDLIFLDYFAATVVNILNAANGTYTIGDVSNYIGDGYIIQSFLIQYVKKFWQANMPTCPGGLGVGSKM